MFFVKALKAGAGERNSVEKITKLVKQTGIVYTGDMKKL